MSKGSRSERYHRANAKKTVSRKTQDSEFEMTQVQKVVMFICVGLGIIASWVVETILGFKGILPTMIFSGIGGGLGSLVGIGFILLTLTARPKTKTQEGQVSIYDLPREALEIVKTPKLWNEVVSISSAMVGRNRTS